MKAIKLTSENPHFNNRLVVNVNNHNILVATPVEPTMFLGYYVLSSIMKNGSTEEVNLEDFKWLKPHLHKMIRKEMTSENV